MIKNEINIMQKKPRKHWHVGDRATQALLLIPTLLSASFVLFIVIFVSRRGLSPFLPSVYGDNAVNWIRFLTGTTWFQAPNIYGVFFIIVNTLYIVMFAAMLSVPIGVITALFITKMTPKGISHVFQTVIELLASIPSIVYGVFGVGIITKLVMSLAEVFNLQTAGGLSTLSTILVLAIMILPTVTLVSVTAIRAVNPELEKNSLALGATKTQTMFRITLVSAKSGIFAGIILGIGRALGEATAVSLVAGNAGSGPTLDLFSTTRTLTSTMLLGLKETVGLDYDIRFSVGIVLIVVVILSNVLLNAVKRRVGRFS